MKKIINFLLINLVLFLNLSLVKAEVIDDLVNKLPTELNNCYGKIYNKDAEAEKINYKVSLVDDMLYITQEKNDKTTFVTGFTFVDNIISYEESYNKDTDYQELEMRNKVNYLAIFNLVTKLSGYTENYNNQIIDILQAGNFSYNGYNLKREENSSNIKEDFKINLNNFIIQEELDKENINESNRDRRIFGYIIAIIIVIIGVSLLIYLNRDIIFGGKFFK